MKRILIGIGRAFGSAGRATIALVGICGVVAALANNYALTQGTGTTFGSLLISSVNYAQQLLCDATTPSQCAAVSGAGAVKVDGSAATQPVSATALPLPTGAGTAANQATVITNTGNTATSAATTATNTGTTATNTATTATNVATSNTNLGAPGATACTTDTASCSLNQLLQRVAQRISSLIALLPTSLGTGGGLKIDGSGTALPVSASALPLPAGAATAAKQPALGTAGSPSADVISVQGVSGGTPQPMSLASGVLGTSTPTTAVPTAGTFSALLATNASRRACLIQNVGTTLGYIYPAATGGTTSNAFQIQPGGTFSCTNGVVTITDALSGTCASSTCAFVVSAQ